MKSAEQPRYVTAKELAEHYGVSAGTIRKLIKQGVIPALPFSDRILRLDFQEATSAIEKHFASLHGVKS